MELKITKTAFEGWQDAYRLQLGNQEMIAVAEVGPRILSLRVSDGPNLLYVDPATRGQGQGDEAWHTYGGHRIWVSPESEDAYRPDNSPCQALIEGQQLTLLAQPDPDTRLRKRLSIGAAGGRFWVESAVLNTSDFVHLGGVWALTCVVPQGAIAFPWGPGGNWDVKRIQYWARWAQHTSQIGSAQYRPSADLFVVQPTGEEGKVGTLSPEGWVALCRKDATFIKSFSVNSHATYPDGGCALEVYTCPDFIEMETLGPLTLILPGQEVVQREVWTLTAQAVSPEDGAALRGLL